MELMQLVPILMVFLVLLALLFWMIKKNSTTATPLPKEAESVQDTKESNLFVQNEVIKQLLPLRIQASERLVLLLERMQPRLLVARHLPNHGNAFEMAQAMLLNIREEYEHNLSQQLYVSDTAWQMVITSKEEIVQMVHLSLTAVHEDADANELAKTLLTQDAPELINHAIRKIRDDLNAIGSTAAK